MKGRITLQDQAKVIGWLSARKNELLQYSQTQICRMLKAEIGVVSVFRWVRAMCVTERGGVGRMQTLWLICEQFRGDVSSVRGRREAIGQDAKMS